MDDKHIEFLQQEAKSLRSSADSIPVPLNTSLLMRANNMKAAAARLRELAADNEILSRIGRDTCDCGSIPEWLSRWVEEQRTDARNALEKP